MSRDHTPWRGLLVCDKTRRQFGFAPGYFYFCSIAMEKPLTTYLNALYPISDADAAAIDSEADLIDIAKGSMLINQGYTDTSLWVIVSGVVRVFAANNGVESTVGFGSEGDPLFSSMSFYRGGKAFLSIQALTPLRVYRITGEALERLVAARPAVAIWMYHMVCGQAAALEMKLRHYLGIDAYERFVKFCRDRSEILPHVHVGVLAEYLGMTRETLSRCRARYARERK